MDGQIVIFIMGVSGCGKTTIGQKLAASLDFAFYDGDDFHPEANIQKMQAGIPLNDEERKPWLTSINEFVKKELPANNMVFACSALKAVYRKWLEEGLESSVKWVFLKGEKDTILHRLQNRTGHFMPESLLDSQFETLETPQNALVVDVQMSPDEIITSITQNLTTHGF